MDRDEQRPHEHREHGRDEHHEHEGHGHSDHHHEHGHEHEHRDKHSITIFIDETSHRIDVHELTGAQLKRLAGRPETYQIFQERPGEPDRLIGDNEKIRLHEGEHFHTVPPAQFG